MVNKKILLGILVLVLVFGMTVVGCEEEKPSFSYEKTTYNENGHSYAIINEITTWNEAKSYCEGLKGHLATITSQGEQTFIENLLKRKENNKNLYWLGGYATNGTWRWVTGEPFTSYNNWNESHSTLTLSNEDKLQIYRAENPGFGGLLGEWEDDINEGTTSFYQNVGFICEWD